jgi:hypothetical protein
MTIAVEGLEANEAVDPAPFRRPISHLKVEQDVPRGGRKDPKAKLKLRCAAATGACRDRGSRKHDGWRDHRGARCRVDR